jgi:hypothetical protein
MTRKYKKVQKETEELEYIECDHCHSRSVSGNNWSDENYSISQVRLEFKEGYQFPGESEDVEKQWFDICPFCWKERVVPALKESGFEPMETKEHGHYL